MRKIAILVIGAALGTASCGDSGGASELDAGGDAGIAGETDAEAGTNSPAQKVTVRGSVRALGETESIVPSATVSVYGSQMSTTTDAQGRFSLEDVPYGDTFFLTQAEGHWGSLDYYAVPQETSDSITLYVIPDERIALAATALSRTIDEDHGGVYLNFYEGAQGGESGSLSASSDEPFTLDASGAPLPQDTIYAEQGEGTLLFTGVEAGRSISAEVSGADGVTSCEVDEAPGTKYPILAKTFTVIYGVCRPGS